MDFLLHLGTLSFVACFREILLRLMNEFVQSGPRWPLHPPYFKFFFAVSMLLMFTNDSTNSSISLSISGKPRSANFTMHSFNSDSSSTLNMFFPPNYFYIHSLYVGLMLILVLHISFLIFRLMYQLVDIFLIHVLSLCLSNEWLGEVCRSTFLFWNLNNLKNKIAGILIPC